MPSLRYPLGEPPHQAAAFFVGADLVKYSADTPQISYGLSGRFYISASGWGLLSVPNALVRGAFSALHEPGIELPPNPGDQPLNAHISVLRPDEIEKLGGPDKLKPDRGKSFRYTLGPIASVTPANWVEISKVWFIKVKSPELEKLRKSFGLSALPSDGKFDFHITIGVRRKKVLQENEVSKIGD